MACVIFGDKIVNCSPVVRSETLDLARIVNIDGRGKRGIVGFEQKVEWIRDIGTRVVFVHGGLVVATHGSFCDVGHWAGCLESTIVEAKKICSRYQVTAKSSMEVVVLVDVEEIPVLPSPEGQRPKGVFGRTQYEPTPKDWMRDDRALINRLLRIEAGDDGAWPDTGYPFLKTVKVVDGEACWRSSNADADNFSAIESFKRRWVSI